jgi:UDP-N-acetylmuramyl-tripeptide synthetase
MTFQQVLDGAEVLAQSGDPVVTSVEYDSRRVKPGCLFVAMRGESSDGNRFIDQAISAGAVAVVTDSEAEKPRPSVAWAVVPNGRRALARVSANFYKKPAERIAITGITGTNGKSTTAFVLESILTAAGRKSALIGTIEYHVAGKILPAPHTTPEALELNRIFSEALGNGATDAVMEVSSHALAQERVFGVPFDVAVFTNLTRDHLDYHKTMEEYFAAKRILFEGCGRSGICARLSSVGDRGRDRQTRMCARKIRASRLWPTIHSGRRLCPHRRCFTKSDGAGTRVSFSLEGKSADGIWMRRGSRPQEASIDGRGGGTRKRFRGADFG